MLISGEGTNLQALIDAPDIDVACVVSSRADAPGLDRARRAGIPALAADGEEETLAFLAGHGVDLVVLAGYMRILSAAFVGRYSGRILNVHPALLPAFPGAAAVADAVAPRGQGHRRDGASRRRRARGSRYRPYRPAGGAGRFV